MENTTIWYYINHDETAFEVVIPIAPGNLCLRDVKKNVPREVGKDYTFFFETKDKKSKT